MPSEITSNQKFKLTSVLFHLFLGLQLLKNIEIPSFVTEIFYDAFDICSFLIEISIFSKVIEICELSLEKIKIPNSVKDLMNLNNVLH